jgi:L-threonylcarbamoyladenylate synthase
VTGNKRLGKEEVIVFPTDTVPGIGCFLSTECVEKLRRLTKRPKNKPFAILLSDEKDIEKWVLLIPPCYHKLSGFLPGPLTLIFKGKNTLPQGVLSKNGTVGIRIPNCESVRDLIRDAGMPLIATSANPSGKGIPHEIDEVKLEYDRLIAGSGGSGRSSTVLDISGKQPVLLRNGEISIIEIEKAIKEEILVTKGIPIHILYVCSANICRSPMAEEHLKSLMKDLSNVETRSAGTIAIYGISTSIGATKTLEECNIETHHLSVPVAKPVLMWADFIFVMEEKHKDYLTDLSPENKEKIVFLRNFKDNSRPREIEDPIGKGIETYRVVFSEIERANKRIAAYLRRKFQD